MCKSDTIKNCLAIFLYCLHSLWFWYRCIYNAFNPFVLQHSNWDTQMLHISVQTCKLFFWQLERFNFWFLLYFNIYRFWLVKFEWKWSGHFHLYYLQQTLPTQRLPFFCEILLTFLWYHLNDHKIGPSVLNTCSKCRCEARVRFRRFYASNFTFYTYWTQIVITRLFPNYEQIMVWRSTFTAESR